MRRAVAAGAGGRGGPALRRRARVGAQPARREQPCRRDQRRHAAAERLADVQRGRPARLHRDHADRPGRQGLPPRRRDRDRPDGHGRRAAAGACRGVPDRLPGGVRGRAPGVGQDVVHADHGRARFPAGAGARGDRRAGRGAVGRARRTPGARRCGRGSSGRSCSWPGASSWRCGWAACREQRPPSGLRVGGALPAGRRARHPVRAAARRRPTVPKRPTHRAENADSPADTGAHGERAGGRHAGRGRLAARGLGRPHRRDGLGRRGARGRAGRHGAAGPPRRDGHARGWRRRGRRLRRARAGRDAAPPRPRPPAP